MKLRFSLPNPDEISGQYFFEQSKTTLKAAEKSFKQAIENSSEDDVYIRYDLYDLLGEDTFNVKELKKMLGDDYEKARQLIDEVAQSLSISINS